jgi:spore photoproduct lyase
MRITEVFIETGLDDNIFVKKFLDSCPDIPNQYFNSYSDLIDNLEILYSNHKAKSVIVFKNNKSGIIKKCPCTKNVTECGYYVINTLQNCYIGCSYCYLQQYVNTDSVIVNSNFESFDNELEELVKNSETNIRIGSGEFSDSLIFDKYTGISEFLIKKINKYDKVFFELKTKTDDINHLLNIENIDRKKVVFAWSVNPVKIIEKEEPFSASLEQRLAAAEKAADAGFGIAFHFDPMFNYANWEKDYFELVKMLYKNKNLADKIYWISLGTFRSNPELINFVRKNSPSSIILKGEYIRGTDLKLRYPRKIRREMYRKMAGYIRKFSDKTVVYLCMEDEDMWEKSNVDSSEKIINFLPV